MHSTFELLLLAPNYNRSTTMIRILTDPLKQNLTKMEFNTINHASDSQLFLWKLNWALESFGKENSISISKRLEKR